MCDGLAQARIRQQGSGKFCDVTVLHSPRDSDDFRARTLSGPHPEQGADDQERRRAPLRGERRIGPRSPRRDRSHGRDAEASAAARCRMWQSGQQPQPLLNHSALRLCAAAPHRLPHQLVIDVDVRTHIVLCKDRAILCIGSMAHGEAIWPSSRRPSRCKYSGDL